MTPSLLPLLAFLAVVAMIPLALWLMRRAGVGASGPAGLLRQVASLALSPSQRLVIVELGQGSAARWLVLGVSAERIANLATLDALPGAEPGSLPAELAQPQALTVSQLIQRWQTKPGGAASE